MAWRTVVEVDPGGGVATRYYLDLPGFGTAGRGPIETFTKTNSAIAYSAGSFGGNMLATSSGITWGAVGSGPNFAIYVETASPSGTPTFQGRRTLTQAVQADVDNSSYLVSALQDVLFHKDLLSVTAPGGETWTTGQAIYGYTDIAGSIFYTNSVSVAANILLSRWAAGIAVGDLGGGLWGISKFYDMTNNQFTSLRGFHGTKMPDGLVSVPTTLGTFHQFGFAIYSDYGKSVYSTSASSTTPVYRGLASALSGTGPALMAFIHNPGQADLPELDGALLTGAPATEFYQSGYTVYQYAVGVNSWTGTPPNESLIFDYMYVHLPNFAIYNTAISGNQCVLPDFAVDVSLPGTPFGDARVIWMAGIPRLYARTTYASQPWPGMSLNDVPRPMDAVAQPAGTPYTLPGLASPCGMAQGWANTIGGNWQQSVPAEAIPTATVTLWFTAATPFTTSLGWGYADVRSGWPSTPWTAASTTAAPVNTGHHANASVDYYTCTLPAPTLVPSSLGQVALFAGNGASVGTWTSVINGQVAYAAYPWSTILPAWLVGDSDVTPVANPGWIDLSRADIGAVTWSGTPVVAWSGTQVTVDISGVSTSKVSDIRGTDSHTSSLSYQAKLLYKEIVFDAGTNRWVENYTQAMSVGPFTINKPDTSSGANVITVIVVCTDRYTNSVNQTAYFSKEYVLTVTIP